MLKVLLFTAILWIFVYIGIEGIMHSSKADRLSFIKHLGFATLVTIAVVSILSTIVFLF